MKSIISRILVPTDFSDASDVALDYARSLAAQLGASVELLHVLEDPFVAEGLLAEAYVTEGPSVRADLLADARARLEHRATPGVTTTVLFGRGAATIVDYAAHSDANLIVMGTHGRTGLAHLVMGSVAESVVRTARCPVLTIGHIPAGARPPRTAEAKDLQTA